MVEAALPNRWTAVGLLFTLAGPLVLASPPAQILYSWAGDGAAMVSEVVLCLLVGAVLLVLVFGERAPLASVGLVRPSVSSIAWGIGAGFAVFLVLAGIALALHHFGLFDNESASAIVLDLPVWFRIIVAVLAGIVEEALYRGYAIERLATVVRSRPLAGLIAVVAFTLAHVPFWGWGAVATPLFGGAFFTVLYLWRRDLVACMSAHATIDLIGIVVVPALAGVG